MVVLEIVFDVVLVVPVILSRIHFWFLLHYRQQRVQFLDIIIFTS